MVPSSQEVGPEATVTLREITEETVVQICKLSDALLDPQYRMVAPNAISTAQAHFTDKAWFRAIYGEKPGTSTACGGRKWQDRVSRSCHPQGLFPYESPDALRREIRTDETPVGFIMLYGDADKPDYKLGFEPTGEVDEGEIVVRLAL